MTFDAAVTAVERLGFPTVLVFVLLWKVIPALDEIKKALWALSDVEKTHARLKKPLDEMAKQVIADVGHDTRGALGPLMNAIARLRSDP